MPTSPEGFARLQSILVEAYGLPNEPQTWLFVAGTLTATPSVSVHISYAHLVNGVRRLKINQLAQDLLKKPALNELHTQLAAAMKKVAEENPPNDDQSPETELPETDGESISEIPEDHAPELKEEG